MGKYCDFCDATPTTKTLEPKNTFPKPWTSADITGGLLGVVSKTFDLCADCSYLWIQGIDALLKQMEINKGQRVEVALKRHEKNEKKATA